MKTHRPDIAVLDLNLPDMFILEIVRRVREAGSAHQDRGAFHTPGSQDGGGSTALRRQRVPAQVRARPISLLEAFEQILDGGIYVSPQLELDKIFAPGQKSASGRSAGVSERARISGIQPCWCEGIRAKEIAARLDLSPKTVDTYRASLMRKLDIHDVAGLVKFAIQRDLTSTR